MKCWENLFLKCSKKTHKCDLQQSKSNKFYLERLRFWTKSWFQTRSSSRQEHSKALELLSPFLTMTVATFMQATKTITGRILRTLWRLLEILTSWLYLMEERVAGKEVLTWWLLFILLWVKKSRCLLALITIRWTYRFLKGLRKVSVNSYGSPKKTITVTTPKTWFSDSAILNEQGCLMMVNVAGNLVYGWWSHINSQRQSGSKQAPIQTLTLLPFLKAV